MSRGPGRWMLALSAALVEYSDVPVLSVVGRVVERPTRSDHVAARRAARRLAEAGAARAVYLLYCPGCEGFRRSTAERCCGRLIPALVLTRDPATESVPLRGRIPSWVSVARSRPARTGLRATQSAGVA